MAKKIESNYIIDSLKLLKKLKLSNRDLRKTTTKTLETNKNLRRAALREVKKYASVLSGEEKVFNVSGKKYLSTLKERDYKIELGKKAVFITPKKDETVSVSKKGDLTFSRILKDRKSGREVVETIFEPNISAKSINNLDQFETALKEIFPKNKMQRFGFTHYGNVTNESFSDLGEALKKLKEYLQKQNEDYTVDDLQNAIKSFQIIKYQYIDEPDLDTVAVSTDLKNSETIGAKFRKATKAKRNMK